MTTKNAIYRFSITLRSHFLSVSNNITVKQQINHRAIQKVSHLHNNIFHSIIMCHTFWILLYHLPDLVLFTIPAPGTSDMSHTNATRVRQECNISETRAPRVPHKCDTSAKGMTQVRNKWKFLILITTRVKTYYHTVIFTIWQVKDYKERKYFILRITFWKCLFSMPKCVSKVHHKN